MGKGEPTGEKGFTLKGQGAGETMSGQGVERGPRRQERASRMAQGGKRWTDQTSQSIADAAGSLWSSREDDSSHLGSSRLDP